MFRAECVNSCGECGVKRRLRAPRGESKQSAAKSDVGRRKVLIKLAKGITFVSRVSIAISNRRIMRAHMQIGKKFGHQTVMNDELLRIGTAN